MRAPPPQPLSPLPQEKEAELANMAGRRARQEQAQHAADADAEADALRGQLAQLAADFKYNLGLLADRDAELEMMEAQIEALGSAGAAREQVRESRSRQ